VRIAIREGRPTGCKAAREGNARKVALEGAGEGRLPSACAGAPDTAHRGIERRRLSVRIKVVPRKRSCVLWDGALAFLMAYRVNWRGCCIDFVKVAVLLLVTAFLAFVLDSGWHYEAEQIPKVYLNMDTVDQYSEKQGSISVMAENTTRDVGVLARVRGNSTVWTEKQSYSIRFIKKTSMLGMDKSGRWVLLGLPFDKTIIRTPLAFGYAKAIGMKHVSQNAYCELYLNGQYKGLYMMMQPITFGSLALRIGGRNCILERNAYREEREASYITTDSGLRFEINCGDIIDEAYKEECLSWVNLAEAYIQSGNEEQYAQLIDVESFVNMYIVQELVKHIDFSAASDRYYMKDGKLYAGPIWDVDLSMGNVSENYKAYYNTREDGETGDSAEMLWAQRDWYEWLCQDPAFMKRVCERWREIYPITENLVYDNELGRNQIDLLVEKYKEAIADNYDPERGWRIERLTSQYEYGEAFSSHEEAVEHLRDWLIWRIEWLNDEFAWIEEGL